MHHIFMKSFIVFFAFVGVALPILLSAPYISDSLESAFVVAFMLASPVAMSAWDYLFKKK